MVFGLIGAGLGIAQQVMGVVGQAKAAKQQEAPRAAEGGEGAEAAAPKEGKEAKEQGNAIERFVQMLEGAGSIADIKKIRDQALGGVKPEQQENAKRKLDQAILKKLGLGQPGPNGDIEVRLDQKTQQILQELGMKPDEVKGGGGAKAPEIPK